MAIDTELKRRSVAGIGARRRPAVTPDVSKPLEWRQTVAGIYSGIATISVVTIDLPNSFGSVTGPKALNNSLMGPSETGGSVVSATKTGRVVISS